MSRPRAPLALAALLAIVGFAANGCGYSTRPLFDPDIRTVAIDVFDNSTFRRDLELVLTRRVAAEIRQRSPWRVENHGRADAVIRGTLLSVGEIPLSESRDDLVIESSVVVTASIRLVDLASGATLQKAQRTSTVAYVTARGQSLQTALDQSLAELAEDLVQALETWARDADAEGDDEVEDKGVDDKGGDDGDRDGASGEKGRGTAK